MSKEMLHLLCMVWAKEAVIAQNNSGYTMTLKNCDQKVLSSTSRPRQLQEFLDIENFLTLWSEHDDLFVKEPAEISIVYTAMPVNSDGIADSIAIELSHPVKHQQDWVFQLAFRDKRMKAGSYQDIALFIDWIPTPYCPAPIKVLFPELADI